MNPIIKFKKFSVFIVLVLLILLVIGCGNQEPTPAAIVSAPEIGEPKVGAPAPQQPGEEIGISVDVSSGSGVALSYTWNVDGGEIVRGQGSPAITYRVPEEPGTYNIRVTIEWDGQSVEKVTSIKVEAEATETPIPQPPTSTPTSPPPTNTPVPRPTNTTEPTLTPTNTLVPPTNTLIPPTNTPVPVPEISTPNCPNAGSDDTQTFINIIKVEEKAVLTEDLSLAKSIYFDDATIRDDYEGIAWNVTDHYVDLFEKIDFVEVVHFDFEVVKITEDTAWVKTSDYGVIIFADTNERVEYGGEGGSHFIFKKDESGCWLISHFSKGAENEPFP